MLLYPGGWKPCHGFQDCPGHPTSSKQKGKGVGGRPTESSYSPSRSSQPKKRRDVEATTYNMQGGSSPAEGPNIWENTKKAGFSQILAHLPEILHRFLIAVRIENELLHQPSKPTWSRPCQPLQLRPFLSLQSSHPGLHFIP